MNIRRENIQGEAGFTLVEVMVTVAIFAIVLSAVYSAFISQFNSYQTQQDVVTVQSDIRTAAEILTRDIRNAGFGVPTGAAVTTIATANASSISLNLAGTTSSTYVTTTNYTASSTPCPCTYVVPVASTAGFQVNQKYNAIDIRTKTVEMGNGGSDKITAVNAAANTITLTGTLATNFVLNVGDLIVTPGFTPVTYSLVTPVFSRTDPVSGSTINLSNNVQSFSLSYIMTDGTTVTSVPAASLPNISAVNFTINGESTQNVSKMSGAARTRTVNAIVALRNF